MSQRPFGAPGPRTGPDTVAALLRQRLESRPDALAYRFLTGIDGASRSWTYRDLDRHARAVAARLQRENLRGRPVLLLHPPGLHYIAAFLGCLYAGALAVPAYPPDTARFGRTMSRLAAVARDAGARHALTTDAIREFAATRREELDALGLSDLSWLATDGEPAGADDWRDPGTSGGSLAFLQYTSGSTSTPKGVMVSNDNILHNLDAIHRRLAHDADSAMVLWLPPYHDMGLIGGILSALHSGIPLHFMAPMTFVQRPLLWLETLSRTRATTGIAPDFGYQQCLRRVTPEQRDALDLSHWRLALNGAEPVRADTLDRFAEFFAPAGFRRRALLPCYGLAEATLLVSGVRPEDEPSTGSFDAARLADGAAVPAADGESRVTRVVSCGPAADGVGIAIVDPDTRRRVPEGRIGEVWVSGPGVARGYWRRPDATEETFRARLDGDPDTPYLRTGDLGFLRRGELHLAGRTKDLVIVQGLNLYPHDVEATVERTDDTIRPHSGAAFGVPAGEGEELVVAYEVDARRLHDAPALLARLRGALAQEHEVTPHAVVLLKRSSVHKTTSGKVQRAACRQDFLDLRLTAVAASVVRSGAEPPAGRGRPDRATAADAVARAVAEVTGAADTTGAVRNGPAQDSPARDAQNAQDARDAHGGLAGLGLDYGRLLEAVRLLEQRFGVELPLGEVLVRPRTDTLVALLLGEEPGAEPDAEPSPAAASGGSGTAPDRTRGAAPVRAAELEEWLTARVAARLGLPPSAVDVTQPFAALGLASRHAVALCEELGERLGRTVTTAAVFDHPTIRAVATALSADPGADPSGAAASPAPAGRTPERGTPRTDDEPIAVVGMGCRLPGAPDVESYWRLLLDGRDAVTDVPPDRWDADAVRAPGSGGFLDRVDEFDARFFRISAREARRMDPQQRLLLETAWQTFEHAGIDPVRLAGSDTGVFVGISGHDYYELQSGAPDGFDVHAATGNAQSVAANRLSYTFDLRGPSLALDTACSSSLVAVHTAIRSLRDGECRVALAGGVNLLLTPGLSVAFADGGMLSADGRCRTFDAAADGYVRGEGAGLVCLKPLSAALADGDRVHAVLRGSAVGHGGRGNGLTAPRSSAQRQVIEQALDRSGLRGTDVGYVEAHGTGTPLGDPVEWEALAASYGRRRPPGTPCLVGSVKGNLGHLEAAAGIAGLLKAALVVRERRIPPQLHLDTPSPRLDWEGSGLQVLTRPGELPAAGTARAAVSSFGFGGMNAHVVLEAPPAAEEPPPATVRAPRSAHALCLSGHTPTALTALARRYRAHLTARPEQPLADVCHTANTGRAHLGHRAVVVGGTAADLDRGLAALTGGEPATGVVRDAPVPGTAPRTAFLFSGQGTQYTGMGRALYDAHPVVARSLERSDAVLRPLLGTGLPDLLFEESGAERLRDTRYCQPALVALEIALAELWAAAGVRPAALLGHSVGAYSAACVAGVLSQEDALRLTAVRAAHMAEQPGAGAMIACVGDPDTVRELAAARPEVAVAAENAPGHLVLSGPAARIREVGEALESRNVLVRPLAVSHAFHSGMMAGAAAPLRAAARETGFAKPEIPWVSDATGAPVESVDADYWADHLLGTVRFADGVATLRRLGCDGFVEIGPHPTLLNLARPMLLPPGDRPGGTGGPGADGPATADGPANPEQPLRLPTLRRGGDDWETFLLSLGRLHCAGAEVDWSALDEPGTRTRVAVPHTVLERESYWYAAPPEPAPQRTENGVHDNGPAPAPLTGHGDPATGGASMAQQDTVEYVSQVCGFPADRIPPTARLGADLGFDSLMKTELERRIGGKYPHRLSELRRQLPEDPSVQDLVAVLEPGRAPASAPAVPQPSPYVPQTHQAPQTPQAVYASQAPQSPYAPQAPAQPYRPQAAATDPVPPAPVPAPAPEPVPAPTPGAAPFTESAGPPVRIEREFEEWAEYAELQGRMRQIESSGANAYGRVHEGHNAARVDMDGRSVVNFSAFNYLALSHHPRVCAAAKEAVDRYGTSSSATPLLCGETPLHHELDAEIASFLGTEAAIVFAGGHATNVATVGHLFGPEDLILHDEWIHDSTVRGCILSGARRRPFPHNDWAALDRMLEAMRGRHRRAVVVIEGAYSQDGDIPDLPRFIEVKKRHDAMLMIDEAHSVGVLGRTGRGVGEHFGVDRRDVDLWMGTLSKAIGSLGGYIAAREPLIRYLKFTAPLFIFSTGISPANAAAALEAFRVIRDEPERVARVQALSDFFRDAARARGFDVGVSHASAVVPIVLGTWERAMTVSNRLLEQGVNVMPIGYPAVPRDKSRLRFFINVDHRESDLEHSLDLLRHAMTNDAPHDPAPRSAARSAVAPAPAPRTVPQARPGGPEVLVAGAGGFLGGHLTRRLVQQGHTVRVLVREGSDRSAFADLPVEVEVGSLGNTDSLRRATAGVRHVYNCTGKSADWGPWREFQHVNVEGCRNLFEAAHDAGTVERFLHVSTTDVYGYPVRPCDETAELNDIGLPYNRSKILGEIVVREAAQRTGLPLTIVRPVSVYGPRSKDFVIEMARLLLQKQMVYIRRGEVPAGLLYVDNAVDAMIAACTSDATVGRAYNLRDAETTTWRQYLEALAQGLGVAPPSLSLPRGLATAVATASEKAYGALHVKARPVLTRHAVHLLERDQSYSIERARTDFGFKSETGFEEGMRRTLAWLDSEEGRRHVPR